MPRARTRRRKQSFLHEHSLTIASVLILITWIGLYTVSTPDTHLGSFFGNAIADWSGVVIMVFATKYLYERGSAESRRPPRTFLGPAWERRLRDHSLSIFLVGDRNRMDWAVCFDAARRQMGSGRRQHRLGMDADLGPRRVDEEADRAAFEGEHELAAGAMDMRASLQGYGALP